MKKTFSCIVSAAICISGFCAYAAPIVTVNNKTLEPMWFDSGIGEGEIRWSDNAVTYAAAYDVNISSPEYAGSYFGKPYITVNNNKAYFDAEDLTTVPFETYSMLDDLGRCGEAYANICIQLMPTEPRESIGNITPSGWHNVKYDNGYVYNRCHLIGFQLAGENDNERNLITGTRYLNIEGMLDFENAVADYVKETNNHVLYRVTPFYTEDNLVANAVEIEAYSVEDNGEGINFNVYCYNVQPGIYIDYKTGENCKLADFKYILTLDSKLYHTQYCPLLEDISEDDTVMFNGTVSELWEENYKQCSVCLPQ